MKSIIDKRNYLILFVIIVLSFFILFNKEEIYVNSFNKDDKNITVMIYENVGNISKDLKKIIDNSKNDVIAYDIKNYLKSKNIHKYLINEDGDITAGKRYGKYKYKISINDPHDGKVLKIVSLENESMVTYKDDYNCTCIIGKDIVKISNIKNNIDKNDYNDMEVLWYKDGKITMTDGFKKYTK